MNSRSNLIYALAAVTSLALGLGMSFWRAASDNQALMRANYAAELSLAAAQDEIKSLQEKLQRETKSREYAEAGKAVAERSEHSTREKLASANEALRASEAGRTMTESALQDARTQLAQTEESRRNIESAWQQAEYTVITVTAQLNEQTSARKTAEAALATAEDQVRLLNAKLAPETASQEKPALVRPVSAIDPQPAGVKEKRHGASKANRSRLAASKNRIILARWPWPFGSRAAD